MQTSSLATATTCRACVALPFTGAAFSLLKRSQLWDISKAKSFAELETERSLPILGSAGFGERERCRTAPGIPFPGPRQCQGHSPRHAFGRAPFLLAGLPGLGSSAAALYPGWRANPGSLRGVCRHAPRYRWLRLTAACLSITGGSRPDEAG